MLQKSLHFILSFVLILGSAPYGFSQNQEITPPKISAILKSQIKQLMYLREGFINLGYNPKPEFEGSLFDAVEENEKWKEAFPLLREIWPIRNGAEGEVSLELINDYLSKGLSTLNNQMKGEKIPSQEKVNGILDGISDIEIYLSRMWQEHGGSDEDPTDDYKIRNKDAPKPPEGDQDQQNQQDQPDQQKKEGPIIATSFAGEKYIVHNRYTSIDRMGVVKTEKLPSPIIMPAGNATTKLEVFLDPKQVLEELPLMVPNGYVPVLNASGFTKVYQSNSSNWFLVTEKENLEIPLALDSSSSHYLNVNRSQFTKPVGISQSEWPLKIQKAIDFAKTLSTDLEKAEFLTEFIKANFKYSYEKMDSALGLVGLARLAQIQCDGAAGILIALLRDQFQISTRFIGGWRVDKPRKIDGIKVHDVRRREESIKWEYASDHAWVEVADSNGVWHLFDPTPSSPQNQQQNGDSSNENQDGESKENKDGENSKKDEDQRDNKDKNQAQQGEKKDQKGDPKAQQGEKKDQKGDPKAQQGEKKDQKGDPKAQQGEKKDQKGDPKGDKKEKQSNEDQSSQNTSDQSGEAGQEKRKEAKEKREASKSKIQDLLEKFKNDFDNSNNKKEDKNKNSNQQSNQKQTSEKEDGEKRESLKDFLDRLSRRSGKGSKIDIKKYVQDSLARIYKHILEPNRKANAISADLSKTKELIVELEKTALGETDRTVLLDLEAYLNGVGLSSPNEYFSSVIKNIDSIEVSKLFEDIVGYSNYLQQYMNLAKLDSSSPYQKILYDLKELSSEFIKYNHKNAKEISAARDLLKNLPGIVSQAALRRTYGIKDTRESIGGMIKLGEALLRGLHSQERLLGLINPRMGVNLNPVFRPSQTEYPTLLKAKKPHERHRLRYGINEFGICPPGTRCLSKNGQIKRPDGKSVYTYFPRVRVTENGTTKFDVATVTVIAYDTSGSMGGIWAEFQKLTIMSLIDRLLTENPKNKILLFNFDTYVRSKTMINSVAQAIDVFERNRIVSTGGGGTDIQRVLLEMLQAIKDQRDNFVKQGENSIQSGNIVLLSDGQSHLDEELIFKARNEIPGNWPIRFNFVAIRDTNPILENLVKKINSRSSKFKANTGQAADEGKYIYWNSSDIYNIMNRAKQPVNVDPNAVFALSLPESEKVKVIEKLKEMTRSLYNSHIDLYTETKLQMDKLNDINLRIENFKREYNKLERNHLLSATKADSTESASLTYFGDKVINLSDERKSLLYVAFVEEIFLNWQELVLKGEANRETFVTIKSLLNQYN